MASTAANGAKHPAPFVKNLYDVLNDPSASDAIVWLDEGNGFNIVDESTFLSSCMPRLCKSTSLCAFIRQANGYGFAKADTRSFTFVHPVFHRNHPERLVEIVRRKSAKRSESGRAVPDPEEDGELSPAPSEVMHVPTRKRPAGRGDSPPMPASSATRSLSGSVSAASVQPGCPEAATAVVLDAVSTLKNVLCAAASASAMISAASATGPSSGVTAAVNVQVRSIHSAIAGFASRALHAVPSAPAPPDLTAAPLDIGKIDGMLSNLLMSLPQLMGPQADARSGVAVAAPMAAAAAGGDTASAHVGGEPTDPAYLDSLFRELEGL